MNLFNLEKALYLKKTFNWPFLYIVVDLHDTIVYGKSHPKYVKGEFGLFPDAELVLKYLTDQKDIKLILYSSSSSTHIEEFQKFAKERGIVFDYINCNGDPDCQLHSDTASFTHKFYYNVMLDDRAGLDGETDWTLIKQFFEKKEGRPLLV